MRLNISLESELEIDKLQKEQDDAAKESGSAVTAVKEKIQDDAEQAIKEKNAPEPTESSDSSETSTDESGEGGSEDTGGESDGSSEDGSDSGTSDSSLDTSSDSSSSASETGSDDSGSSDNVESGTSYSAGEPPSEESKPEEKEKPEDKPTEDSSDDSEDTADDTKESKDDSKNKEDDESKKDEDKKDDKEKPAQESLRTLNIELFRPAHFALEDFSETASSIGTGISTAAGYAWKGISATASALAFIGVSFGVPLIKTLYKGVLYFLVKLGDTVGATVDAISKYVERQKNALSNLDKSIKAIETRLSNVTDNSIKISGKYTRSKVIDSLSIGESVDFDSNLNSTNDFLNKEIGRLHQKIHNDYGVVMAMSRQLRYNHIPEPESVLSVDPQSLSLNVGNVKGYEIEDEYRDPVYQSFVMPGNIILVGSLPKKDLTDLDEYSKAYKSSGLFLGINTESYVAHKEVDYMTVEQLKGFAKTLRGLLDSCNKHQGLYKSLEKVQPSLKISFSNYVKDLTSQGRKLTMKESFVGVMYLKTSFISKVYIPVSMDLHDHTAKIIQAGISLVEDHLKAFE